MANGDFIAYYRVSTQRQGQSGLGLDAQRHAVTNWLNGGNHQLLGEFTDVETGKHANRPELTNAMEQCKLTGATLVIAKLDRLSRDAAFLIGLQKSGIKFVAVDMPDANNLTIGIMAVMAQHEREMISKRTVEALAAAKRRGVKLGGARPGTGLHHETGNAAWIKQSDDFAGRVHGIIKPMHNAGQSLRDIASALELNGIKTQRGGTKWTATGVKRILERMA